MLKIIFKLAGIVLVLGCFRGVRVLLCCRSCWCLILRPGASNGYMGHWNA